MKETSAQDNYIHNFQIRKIGLIHYEARRIQLVRKQIENYTILHTQKWKEWLQLNLKICWNLHKFMDEGNFAQKEKLHWQLTKIQNDDTKDKRLINMEIITWQLFYAYFALSYVCSQSLRLLLKLSLCYYLIWTFGIKTSSIWVYDFNSILQFKIYKMYQTKQKPKKISHCWPVSSSNLSLWHNQVRIDYFWLFTAKQRQKRWKTTSEQIT